MNSFREYLLESSKKFNIVVDDIEYKVIKSYHIYQPRGNNKIPRDGNMSVLRYTKLLQFIDTNINNADFAIIWTNKDTANGIYGVIDENNITIITAILKEKLNKKDRLFRTAKHRYDLGEFTF